MQLFRKITGLRCLLFIFLTLGLVHSARGQTTPEALVAGTTGRIDALFQADSGKAFVPAKVLASLGSGRPYYSRAYSWSVAGFAARCFYLGEMLPQANAALIQNGKYYLRQLTPQEEASILDANAGVEQNTGQYARITNRDSVHWHADIILRLIDMYGTNGSAAAGRMSAEAEAKSLEYIWQYVRLIGKLSKAEYLVSKTWDSYESENHHAMDFRTHWHFSKIAKDHNDYKNLTTASGATAAQLYEAYNNYFIEYARERFRKGLFAEMMNRGYNSATYSGFYNFYDFGNPEVREHARMLLDLFWAYYAQEQFNDVVGGGASRIDFSAGFTAGHAGTTGALAWAYFGMVGSPSSVDGRSINPYFSSYRPPAVIADIATDIAGRGTYEIRQTAQGLGVTGSTNPDVSQANTPHRLRTDGGGIMRYSYCNPAFIMGLPMLEARPKSSWVDYCSQSRWQGVVFSANRANEMARIVPCVLPTNGEDTFNPHWGVQSKGSMITQMLNTHSGGKEMWVFISKQGLNANPFIEDNIVFVDIAGAYAAIRVVGTTYTLHEDYDPDIRPHFLVRLTDKFKPVILEVMAKTGVANFAAFKQLVKTNTPGFSGGLVTYTTIYGDALTFDANYNNKPTINGVPVDYSPVKSYDSPFLHGDYNGDTFVIEKGSRQEIYSMSSPPLVTGFSPADNSVDVAINANLTVTFNESISAGSGLIAIKNLTNSTQSTIDITDATQVSISGATLTINPTNNLLHSRVYAIQIAPGAVEDATGDAFPGITNDTTWNFTTAGTLSAFTVVQSGSHIDGIIDATAGGKTITINAGAADFLIVGTSTEFGSGNTFTATYDGNLMSFASGNGSQSNLFYLDLTQTTYSGGNANLTFTWNYTTGGDLSVGWVSVDGHLRAGESIVLHNTAFADSTTNTVSLVTTANDTFNFVTFNGNRGNDASAPAPPLTEIYSDGDFGSNAGAAGYEEGVNSGTYNYSWNHNLLRRIDAAAFVVVGDYSVWIADYPGVGAQTGLADDPDNDGIPSGVEQFFGTAPDVLSTGLLPGVASGNTFTFTHPQGTLATDLSAAYLWSKDLGTFAAGGATDSGGTRVDFTVQPNSPSVGITTVTATITGTPTARLFVVVQVTQN